MDEKNNGARRRRAFADFKENQYDDSFSLNPIQQKRNSLKKWLTITFIVILTVVFIILGFCFTDSLMTISEKPYKDRNTYTAAYVNTTSAGENAEENSENPSDESQSSVSEESSSAAISPYQSSDN